MGSCPYLMKKDQSLCTNGGVKLLHCTKFGITSDGERPLGLIKCKMTFSLPILFCFEHKNHPKNVISLEASEGVISSLRQRLIR